MDGQFDDAEDPEDYNNSKVVYNQLSKQLKTSNGYEEDEEEEEDDDDYDWDDDDDEDMMTTRGHVSAAAAVSAGYTGNKFETNSKRLSRFDNRINEDKYLIPGGKSLQIIQQTERRMTDDRRRVKDKSDRQTQEQVLDPKTRIILFKLINRQLIHAINGVISTGKEANVYHATSPPDPDSDGSGGGQDKAVKIYKTSILTFKDRDKYVSGEFRFRHGYCRRNPRKMVRTWAEKEMRNLARIYQSGIPCPRPYCLRSHVLVMDFIGTNGLPAPLLKDVDLSESRARQLYHECIVIMRKLFTDCRLVHSDLSEFNLLYNDSRLYVIDVSQSVESDHPLALEFLRKDCVNINDFFRKKSVPVMTTRELFDFITDPNIDADNMDDYLEKAKEIAANRTTTTTTGSAELDDNNHQQVDDEVFKSVYIPQRLREVANYERDVHKTDKSEIYYQTITALRPDLKGPTCKPTILDNDDDNDGVENGSQVRDDSDDSSVDNKIDSKGHEDQEEDEEVSDKVVPNSARPKDETTEEKKLRKNALKEEKREKRKNKIPKHVKKRKERLGKNPQKN
ncbi:serine/threonine-protein kinase RIO1-like [Oppia nitens]|uniref:serine/threonine-protein kinase RIO1-like n=1 Tax=Oppia nitens TaxID=1686743 RepID=UPI0023DA98C1|nr:serine/threonine-protein kinase RIO1-like [Oppia nitens]